MSNKTDAFKGGDDHRPPHQSTSSNDDSEDQPTDDACQTPTKTNRSPLFCYSELSSSSEESGLFIDLSPEKFSDYSTSGVLADASGSFAQSSENTFHDVPLDAVGNDGYSFEAYALGPSRLPLGVSVPVPSIPSVIAYAPRPPRPALQAAIQVPSISLVKADAPEPALEAVASVPSIPPVKVDVPRSSRPVLEAIVQVPSILPVTADAQGSSRFPSERDVSGPSSDTRPRVTLDSFPSRFVFALVSPKKRTCVDDSRISTDKHIQQDLIGSERYSATLDGTKYYYKHKDSSSESDSCAESHPPRKVWSVHNKKRSKNDSTRRSVNVSNDAVSPRLDQLAIVPIQNSLTPPSQVKGVRLSKSSPRKRLKRAQLDQQKSTSPGTSYSKLSRSSSVDNVHRTVLDFEVISPMSYACSENQPSLTPEISGSPRLAEPVSRSSSLASSSGHGNSTTVRPLSSETWASTSCDSNPLIPIAHFDASNNPSLHGCDQNALPAHLQKTRITSSSFGSRIISPPVQPSCQLPRLRMFPELASILNVTHHNRVLNSMRTQPPQETNFFPATDQQISQQLSGRTEKLHASIEVGQTAFDCYDKVLDNIIKETLSSSNRDSPVPSETDSLTSSEAPLDGLGTLQGSCDFTPFGDYHTQYSEDVVCLSDHNNSPYDTENISSGRNYSCSPNICLEMPISSTLARSSRLHHHQPSGSNALDLLTAAAVTQKRQHSSSIHELSSPLIPHRPPEGILPSTSNIEDGASFPFIPVFPGEASTSNYQPSSLTLSMYQPSLSDFLQSVPLSERVSGIVTYLLSRRSSHFAEEAKNLLHDVCRDIVRDKGNARWLECNRPSRRTSSPTASWDTEHNFSKRSEQHAENKTGPFLGINASCRPDLMNKECYAVGLREAILSLSSNALSTTSSSQIPDLGDMLRYYNACSVLSQVFTPFKAVTLLSMDSADHSFRQRMPTLLDQISSYLARLQFALENLLLYICENTTRRGY